MNWLFEGSSSSPSRTAPATPAVIDEAAAAGCPVDHSTRSKWMQKTQQTVSTSDPHPFAAPSTRPSASASATTFDRPLSQERETSSIPRFTAKAPDGPVEATAASPSNTSGKWVYPSPSQFYTALQRKNRSPRQEDMEIVVPIHNAVNERTWNEVMKWENEALASEAGAAPVSKDAVQLVSFIGRPQDRTPRAWWKTLLGYQPPFDRHDWIIDRDGKRIRYVIDFYTGRGGGSSLPAGVPPQLAFYLDVRPAIDGFEGIKMRVRRNLNRLFGLGSNLERKDQA